MRCRVDYSPLGDRRRAEIVLTIARVAVFIDGCFWHGYPEHATRPRSNSDYWTQELYRNTERDRVTDRELGEAGWSVLRFWKHEDAAHITGAVISSARRDGDETPRIAWAHQSTAVAD
ncbi:very short patch repair endonuclease [Microbacterium candidum]|uniref:Very short patch repair endonuclease n=1 Tax=Microbacterium candidum TaxID=3041922 RepID=A0ABT7N3A7_9MICO|nr:very short patch repair endonuclease [Microbacterium sp. ASV49]MDL9981189.1 very short patch repair endonuclease [Microbacterium sp. ASV49]